MGITVCFTGHRSIPEEDRTRLAGATEWVIRRLIAAGADCFCAGGAYGFDTVAELKVLECKRDNPSVRLELYLPCRDQTAKWNPYDRAVYEQILRRADRVTYESEAYTSGCMLARNRRMVDASDVCVAYLRRESGGSAYTASYAQSKGLRVISLAEVMDGLDKFRQT